MKITVLICVLGLSLAYAEHTLLKRGVVVGDDQYIEGHIRNGPNTDLFIGTGPRRPGYGGGRGAGSGYDRYKRQTVLQSPYGVRIGTGNTFDGGRGASRGSARGSGYDDGYSGRGSTYNNGYRGGSGVEVRPANGYNDGITIGNRNTIRGGISTP